VLADRILKILDSQLSSTNGLVQRPESPARLASRIRKTEQSEIAFTGTHQERFQDYIFRCIELRNEQNR
jgi:hypothetical protein